MTEQDNKFLMMTKKPVQGLVVKLAIPSVVIMLISALYNLADTYFVSVLGESATAAVGLSLPLMSIIQAVGFFFGHGSGNYISRALGAKNHDTAAKMAATGFFSSFGSGLIISALGLISLNPMMRFLGATDTNIVFATSYARYIIIGIPFMISSLTLNNLLRFQGNALYGMLGMVSGAVINIGLDPLFIHIFDMGVGGAALATIISQIISFIILLIGCQRPANVHIRLRNYRFDHILFRHIFNGGSPSLLRQGLMAIANVILNRAAGVYGDSVLASVSIVGRITMFAVSTMMGFGQGFQPVCGFNYGAGLNKRVKEAFWFCTWLMTGILTLLGILGYIFAPQLIGIFAETTSPVIDIGTNALRFQCLSYPLLSFVIMCNMMTQTMGKALTASFLALARQGIFLIPLVLILPRFLDVQGIQLCLPLSDILGFLVSLPIAIKVLREIREDGLPRTDIGMLVQEQLKQSE